MSEALSPPILHLGDCLDVLREMPDCSIDAIVTDPPYGLSAHPDMIEVLRCWLAGEEYSHSSKGFMGKDWDSFVPGPSVWKECLRVLKPGGHMLAFFGTRTYGVGEVAIRLAGFEIRDQIDWIYGCGFPKNHNVSKAIDKAKGLEREVVGKRKTRSADRGKQRFSAYGTMDRPSTLPITAPASPEAQEWEGWGTALKPAHEPIVLARKPLSASVAANVLNHGTGAINVDGCRISSKESTVRHNRAVSHFGEASKQEDGYVSGGNNGRWPANIILQHSPGCEVVGEVEEKGYSINRWSDGAKPWGEAGGKGLGYESVQVGGGKSPLYQCVEGCPVLVMGQQSGKTKSGSRKAGAYQHMGYHGNGTQPMPAVQSNEGTAARYFLNLPPLSPGEIEESIPFLYCAKPAKKEKNAGLEHRDAISVNDGRDTSIDNPYQRGDTPRKNIHPTVKSISLMRYLCRLITPPGGTVLDPFLGSGTTGIAADLEGFGFVGIEQSGEYLELARARLSHWSNQPQEATCAEPPPQAAKEEKKKEGKETGQDSAAEGGDAKPPQFHQISLGI